MLRLLSWNIGRRDLWEEVAAADHDIALLQEAGAPSEGLRLQVVPEPGGSWGSEGHEARPYRTAVAAPAGDLTLRPYPTAPVHAAGPDRLGVSRPGTLTAADVVRDGEVLLTVASVYGTWEDAPGVDGLIFSDASAHRLLSDLAQLVTGPDAGPLVVCGDWNLLYGYTEDGDPYWQARGQSVFDRAAAMGLRFVGPRSPRGRQTDPWPPELPEGSRNVPTFYDDSQSPSTATRQLDYVFASASVADRVIPTALNAPEEWGASDHCRISVTVDL